MSGTQHHDPIEDNSGSHPVKLAVSIAVGTVALIIGIILTVQLAVGSYGSRSLKGEPSMRPEVVEKRIAPVASLAVDPNAPARPPAPAAAAVAVAAVAIPAVPAHAGAAAGNGKSAYDATCKVCHASGVAGAPKLGDKAAWAPRVKTGKDALYASALKGKGAMPPKGGNTALSDDAVKAAVDYLLAAVK